MNPVVRQILDNIGRLGRELENCEPNPPHPNGGTMSNERTVSVEGEVSRIFRRSAAQPSGSIYTSNATFTSTVNNVITTSTSTSTQQGPSNSTNSTLSPRFRLSPCISCLHKGLHSQHHSSEDLLLSHNWH